MKTPDMIKIKEGVLMSRPVLVYYLKSHTMPMVIVGRYCQMLSETGEREGSPYWIEDGYGLYIENVYGWGEIPKPENVYTEEGAKMRLIDADDLRNRMYNESFINDSDSQRWDSGCWIRYKMFENCLSASQTIDAEPVKHGRWIWKDGAYYCTECQYHMRNNTLEVFDGEYHYCPNCGSKMNLEE